MDRPAATVVTSLIGIGIVALGCGGDAVSSVHRELASVSGRPLEPRLVGGFAHAACVAPRAGRCKPPPSVGSEDFTRLERVNEEVRRVTRGGREAASLHLRAIQDLVLSRQEEDLVAAVDTLEAAVAHAPANAGLHSDLAALRYVRALTQQSPWHLVLALETAEEAVRLDPTLAEARFNHALVLERLHLRGEAGKAWRRYLELDDVPAWTAEARDRLATLESATRQEHWARRRQEVEAAAERGDTAVLEALARDFTMELHHDLRDRWLPEWAAGESTGDDGAGPTIDALRHVARAVAVVTGDPLLADALPELGDDERRRLARGLRAYGAGLERTRAYCHGEARKHFETALAELRPAGSPFAGWVAFADGIRAFYADAEDGSRAMEALLSDPANARYPILRGRAHWVLGTSVGLGSQMATALAHYADARRLLGGAFGAPGTFFLDFLESEVLGLRGEREAAWSARLRALEGLAAAGEPQRWHSAVRSMARSLERDGMARAAHRFLEEAVANAERWGDPYALAASYQSRGQARAAVGDVDGALADFRRAEAEAAPLECDPAFHAGTLADLRLARAAATLRETPAAALEELEAACRAYAEQNDHVHLARAVALRGMTRELLEDPDGAARDLAAAIELFNRQLTVTSRREPRFVADAQRAYRRLVELELARGDARAALAVAERSRVDTRFAVATPRELDELIARPPAATAILVFQDLEHRVAAWRLDGDGLAATFIDLPPEELRRRVERVLDLVVSGDPAADPGLADLHALLTAGTLAGVDAERLIVVPDRSLAALPFAALRGDDGYLADRFAVVVTPCLAAAANAAERRGPYASALVLGNPTTALPPLEAAEDEARRVAALYQPAELLLGDQATRESFLERWRGHAVVHVAAHSTIDVWTPHWWRLHLAPGAAAPGAAATGDLEPDDLAAGPPPRTRLMVLSSCSSALDGSSLARAPYGLVGDFLAAGVPEVIGALWPVDDAATARLMAHLHEGLAAGLDPARALRQAQLALIGSSDPELRRPRAWAAFRLLAGGV